MKSLFEAVPSGTCRDRQTIWRLGNMQRPTNYMTNCPVHPNIGSWPSSVWGNAIGNVDHWSKAVIYLLYSQWFIFVAILNFPFTNFHHIFHTCSMTFPPWWVGFSRLTEAADETGDGVLDREEFIQVQLVDVTTMMISLTQICWSVLFEEIWWNHVMM